MRLPLSFVYEPLQYAVSHSNKLIDTLPPVLNSVKEFPGSNFIFFFKACNVAFSTDLGISLLDILKMSETKSQLVGEISIE